jgi:hypothetical protein
MREDLIRDVIRQQEVVERWSNTNRATAQLEIFIDAADALAVTINGLLADGIRVLIKISDETLR